MRAALVVLLVPLACAKARPRDTETMCVSYVEDVAPRLRQYCSTCHSETRAEGSYVTTSYGAVLANGTDDVSNAIAGREDSRLVEVLDPARADANHREATAVYELVKTWVVDCDVRHRDSLVHAPGILDPASAEFHGALLAGTGDVFESCRTCHGDRLLGGGTQVACGTCHHEGATDCSVCHRDEKVDAPHKRHAGFDCSDCHEKPERYDAAGHLDGVVGVRLSAFGFDGTFDATTKTCAVYCHGDAFDDTAASNTAPTWGPGEEEPCGTCHGLPPSSHAQDDCARCHDVPDAKHVDGAVDVFEACDACHVATSGRHRRHLEPRLRLTSSMTCGDCHLVPETVTAPGHIDSAAPAEVFASEILGESLAAARGATPSWDAATNTCSGVYCHGDATLSWSADAPDYVACGSCHALPPESAPHEPSMTISSCVDCHSSVDRFGNIVFVDGESEHLNGEVDR